MSKERTLLSGGLTERRALLGRCKVAMWMRLPLGSCFSAPAPYPPHTLVLQITHTPFHTSRLRLVLAGIPTGGYHTALTSTTVCLLGAWPTHRLPVGRRFPAVFRDGDLYARARSTRP